MTNEQIIEKGCVNCRFTKGCFFDFNGKCLNEILSNIAKDIYNDCFGDSNDE